MNTLFLEVATSSNKIVQFFQLLFGPDKFGVPRYTYWIDAIAFTLGLTLLALIIGLAIGLVVALLKLSKHKFFRVIGTIYTDIIRGTPVMIQIMLIYMVILVDIDLPKIVIGSIAFGINSGAYVAEIFRAGIQGVDAGQMEAAKSLGLTHTTAMIHVIFPQAIKKVLPTLVSEFIVLLKETAVVGFIAGFDITKAATTIGAQTYNYLAPLLFAAVVYLCLTTVFTTLMRKVERRLAASDKRPAVK